MSDIEHYQNEYENGRTRGILRNNPLANKLGMVEDGLSYSPIKVLALTLQSCIGRTYFASDLLHYFYFVKISDIAWFLVLFEPGSQPRKEVMVWKSSSLSSPSSSRVH